MRAHRDQLRAQREDAGVARGSAGFDDQEYVSGFCPHQFGKGALFSLAQLGNQVARHHKVGGFRVALMDTAKSVGISGEPTIVRPASDKRGLLNILTSNGEDLFPNPSQLLNQAPGFYFMWK